MKKMKCSAMLLSALLSGSMSGTLLPAYASSNVYMLEQSQLNISQGDQYYGSQLSGTAKTFYQALCSMDFASGQAYRVEDAAVLEQAHKYTMGDRTLVENFGAALDCYRFDHMETFYVEFSDLSINVYQQGGKYIVEIGSGRTDSYLKADPDEIPAMQDAYEAALSALVADVPTTSAKAAAEALNKKIIDHVTYSFCADKYGRPEPGVEMIDTAYGALVNQKAICEGYARLFKAAMNKLGFTSELIEGFIVQGNATELHMWNAVRDEDGNWYGVDTTQNDGDRKSSNEKKYFWGSQEAFESNHLLDPVVSSSGYELKYPELYSNWKVIMETSDIEGYLVPSPSNSNIKMLGVSYKGMKATELLEKEGLYLVYRITSQASGKTYVSNWSSIVSRSRLNGGAYPNTEPNEKNASTNYSLVEAFGNNNTAVVSAEIGIMDAPDDYINEIAGKNFIRDIYYTPEYAEEHLLCANTYSNSFFQEGYVIPARVKTTSPANLMTKKQPIGDPQRISITYDEDIRFKEGTPPEEMIPEIEFYGYEKNDRDLDQELLHKYAKVTDVSFDGSRTVSFTFQPSKLYNHTGISYGFTISNMVNILKDEAKSDGIPPAEFYVHYLYKDVDTTCRIFKDSNARLRAYAQPILADNKDLSLEGWELPDGTMVSEGMRSQMALVITQPAEDEAEKIETISEALAEDKGEVLNSKTYEIDLNICCQTPKIPNGKKVTMNLGFPDGMDPTVPGTTYKLYHFKRIEPEDPNEPPYIDYENPEVIDCIVTELGLIAHISSFSPFVLVEIKNEEAFETRNLDVDTSKLTGGTIESSTGSLINLLDLDESTTSIYDSVTYTLKPNEGYEVEYVYLDDQPIEVGEDNTFTVHFDDIKLSSKITAGFVSSQVKLVEEENNLENRASDFAANFVEVLEDKEFANNLVTKPDHIHDFSGDFEKDDDNHWRTCQDPDCPDGTDTPFNVDAHKPVDKEFPAEIPNRYYLKKVCGYCGILLEDSDVLLKYPHEHAGDPDAEYEKDENKHWKLCTVEDDCDQIVDEAAHVSKVIETPATTTEDGSIREVCDVCGHVISETVIPKLHTHEFTKVTKYDEEGHWLTCKDDDATDDEAKFEEHKTERKTLDDGRIIEVCTICNHSTVIFAPDPHKATAEYGHDEGAHWKKCAVEGCEIHYEEEQHTFKEISRTPATEEAKGLAEYECSVCGATRQDILPQLEHTHKASGTYAHDDTQHWQTCTKADCDGKVNAVAHVIEVETTPATTTATGLEKHLCKTCGYVEKEVELPVLHSHEYTVIAHHDETGHWLTCKDEDCTDDEMQFEAHQFERETLEDGKVVDTCAICDHKITVSAPDPHKPSSILDHNEFAHWNLCDVPGCDTRFNEQQHTFKEIASRPATEEEEGLKKSKCEVCGAVKEEVIPRLEHTHKAADRWLYDSAQHWNPCVKADCDGKLEAAAHVIEVEITPATYTETGLEKHFCKTCGFTEKEIILPVLHSHEYTTVSHHDETGHWITCKDGDCTIDEMKFEAHSTSQKKELDGTIVESCSKCGYSKVVYAPKPHGASEEYAHDEWNHWLKCDREDCADRFEEAAHDFQETFRQPATEEASGLVKYQCSVCKAVKQEILPIIVHTHTGMESYTHDDKQHWKPCTKVGCDGKVDAEDHVIEIETTPATETETGLEKHLCKTCGYVEKEVELPVLHSHEYTVIAHHDETGHWLTCKDEDCVDDEMQFEAHQFERETLEDGKVIDTCTICDHKITISAPDPHKASDQYDHNEFAHWNTCVIEGCDTRFNERQHTFEEVSRTPAAEDSEGLIQYECSVCHAAKEETIPALEHTHTAADAYTNDDKQHWKPCLKADCDGRIDAADHVMEVEITPATQSSTGLEKHVCKICGYVEKEVELPVLHSHDFAVVAHHDETGHWLTCSEGDCAEDELKFEAHQTEQKTLDDGKVIEVCTICDHKKVISAPDPHKASDEFDWNDFAHWNICVIEGCDTRFNEQQHTFKEVSTTPATEKAEGKIEYECSVCGATKEETIPVLEHVHEFTILAHHDETGHWWTCKDEDCTDDEMKFEAHQSEQKTLDDGKVIEVCTICDHKKVISAPDPHKASDEFDWNDFAHWNICVIEGCDTRFNEQQHTFKEVSTTPATEKAEGKIEYECSVCGAAKKEVLEQLTPEVHEHEAAAEYVHDDKQHWKNCLDETCTEKLEAEDHVIEVETTPATQTEPGLARHLCKICGYVEKEVEIPLLHTHEFTVIADHDETGHWWTCKDDDCSEEEWKFEEHESEQKTLDDGRVIEVCSICDHKKVISAPASHEASDKFDWNDFAHWNTCVMEDCDTRFNEQRHTFKEVSSKPATEDSEGLIQYECSVCGATKEESIPALEHTHEAADEYSHDEYQHWKFCKGATCTEKLDVGDHVIEVETTPATESETGMEKHFCKVCGYVEKAIELPVLHVHEFTKVAHHDETGHWLTCEDEDCPDDEMQFEEHDSEEVTEVDGRVIEVCSICDHKKVISAPDPHQASDEYDWNEFAHWNICEIPGCDTRFHERQHDFVELSNTPATEDEEGSIQYECSECGAVKEEVLPRLEHVHHEADVYDHDDEQHWIPCKGVDCEEKFELDHHKFAEVSRTEATVDAEGKVVYECKVCQASREEVIAKLDAPAHKHETTDAYAYDNDQHWKPCIDDTCTEKLEVQKHTYGEPVIVSPTTTAEGRVYKVCSVCGQEVTIRTVPQIQKPAEDTDDKKDPDDSKDPEEDEKPVVQPEVKPGTSHETVTRPVEKPEDSADEQKPVTEPDDSADDQKPAAEQLEWKQTDEGWTLEGAEVADTWQKVGNTWYHFDDKGLMQTGWLKDNDKWYYLDHSGAMKTQWLKTGDTWYFFESDGSMQTGWKKDHDKWYYLDHSGNMKTGWLTLNGQSYYLDHSGSMKTGWLEYDGSWYYFNSEGSMVKNGSVQQYKLDAQGRCLNPEA